MLIRSDRGGSLSDKKDSFQAFLMILIPLIGFLVFQIYPILWTFRWSFFNYNGIPSETEFVGLANFKRFFTVDFKYWQTWFTTLKFALFKLPIEIPLAMLLASLLNNKRLKGAGLLRSIYYLPAILSSVVVGLIITCMFSYNGYINGILMDAGLITQKIDWFDTTNRAMTMLVIGSTWTSFGINVMYFMAALCNVPRDLYESADIDGASTVKKFFKITVPMIMPVFSTVMLLSVVGTLAINEYIIVVTGGGPSGTTQTVMSYLTQTFVPGFASEITPPLGYGCAMALVTSILFSLTSIGYKWFDKKVKSMF